MSSKLNSTKIITVEPNGHVSAANVREFQQQLTAAVTSQGDSPLLIDMHGIEFLDSAGLMALISAFSLAQSLGRPFILCSLAPSIRMIFELTQLDRVFEIFESRDAVELAVS